MTILSYYQFKCNMKSASNHMQHKVFFKSKDQPLVWVHGQSNKHYHIRLQYPPLSEKAPSCLRVFYVP